MRQTRLKQSVNHLRLSFEAFVFPKALFRNITGEATEAPTEFLANQTVLLKNPKKSLVWHIQLVGLERAPLCARSNPTGWMCHTKKSSPFLHVIKCITDFICFFLVSSLRLVKTGTAKTVPAVLLGPVLSRD